MFRSYLDYIGRDKEDKTLFMPLFPLDTAFLCRILLLQPISRDGWYEETSEELHYTEAHNLGNILHKIGLGIPVTYDYAMKKIEGNKRKTKFKSDISSETIASSLVRSIIDVLMIPKEVRTNNLNYNNPEIMQTRLSCQLIYSRII